MAREGEIVVVYVDHSERRNIPLFEEFEVTGIPALFWYESGRMIDETVGFTTRSEVLAAFGDE